MKFSQKLESYLRYIGIGEIKEWKVNYKLFFITEYMQFVYSINTREIKPLIKGRVAVEELFKHYSKYID